MTNSTFQGPATIVVDGTEIAVTAELYSEGGTIPGWRGVLEADDPNEDFWAVMRTNELSQLRMPDGRTGQFIGTNSSVGSGIVTIAGSGPQPF